MKKSLAVVDPKMARDAVKKHLQRLQNSSNGVQFEAQLHERDMVTLLVDMAQDADMPPAIRRACANDVLVYARGQPKTWLHDGETINPALPGAAGLGATIGQELDAARQTARLHEQLALLTASNTHPRDWPEEVRSIATDIVKFYDAEEGVIEGKVA